MSAEDHSANVAPLDKSGKGQSTDDESEYVGARCSRDQKKRYNQAWVMGEYEDRSAFILAACDALADQILGPRPIGQIGP